MSEFQKVIKYIAIFIAIGLATFIIGVILSVILGIGFVTHTINDYNNDTNKNDDVEIPGFSLFDNSYSQEYSDVDSIDISNGIAKLNVYQSDSDKVKVTAENIDSKFQCNYQNNALDISYYKDKQNLKQKNGKAAVINIYVPKTQKLDSIKIDSSIGDINILDLNTKDINISSNIGKIIAQDITADNSKISGGVGNINIDGSTLNNLNVDVGVGNVTINGKITGNSVIDGGVGELSLTIDGSENDYVVTNKGGMGKLTVNGKEVKSDIIINKGEISNLPNNDNKLKNKDASNYYNLSPNSNKIEVNLGVGNVSIDFKK